MAKFNLIPRPLVAKDMPKAMHRTAMGVTRRCRIIACSMSIGLENHFIETSGFRGSDLE